MYTRFAQAYIPNSLYKLPNKKEYLVGFIAHSWACSKLVI